MVYQKKYKYHKMYFVVSLDEGVDPSFDVADYMNNELNMGDSFCQKISVNSVSEWNDAFATIVNESSPESIPIVYVECHGNRNGDLVFGGEKSNERIRMKDFMLQITNLANKCNQKLLLVTAICYGLYFYRKVAKLEDSSPLSCVIGSYTKQSSIDIHERYSVLFKELFKRNGGGNVNSAFHAMGKVYEDRTTLAEWAKGKRYGILTYKKKRFLPE